MLYETVTGRPLFLGYDLVAIMGQHINTPPVAPTWHNPRCSRPFEAVILRLLAKPGKEAGVCHRRAGLPGRKSARQARN